MEPRTTYEKRHPIGRGPWGTVYVGIDASGREVAIKEPNETVRLDIDCRERFYAEAEAAMGVTHDHLVRIWEVDRIGGRVISELMARNTAGRLQNALSADEVRLILKQTLPALERLHQVGCLHADIRPTNLLCDARGRYKLSDARMVRFAGVLELPRPRGSFKYTPPELLSAVAGPLGQGTDIYGLGFLALELLVGGKFQTRVLGAESVPDEEAAWRDWHGSPKSAPPAVDLAGSVPRVLALILDRMVAKDQNRRYKSVQHVLEDLDKRADEISVLPDEPAVQSAVAAHQTAEAARRKSESPPPAQPSVVPTAAAPAVDPPPKGGSLPAASATHGASPIGEAMSPSAKASVVSRPDTPVVVRIASGVRSGQTQGIDADEIKVGDTGDCQLRFDTSEYPMAAGRSAIIRREQGGWQLCCQRPGGLILNQDPVEETAPIRSGDIVRLSPAGPDFQFIVNGRDTRSLENIAEEFLGEFATDPQIAVATVPPGAAVEPDRPSPMAETAIPADRGRLPDTPPAVPTATQVAHDEAPARSLSEPPVIAQPRRTSTSVPPEPPLVSATVSHAGMSRTEMGASGPVAAPPQLRQTQVVDMPSQASDAADSRRDSSPGWLDRWKRVDKNVWNWVVLVASVIIALAIILLAPIGRESNSGTEKDSNESQNQPESSQGTAPEARGVPLGAAASACARQPRPLVAEARAKAVDAQRQLSVAEPPLQT